MALVKSINNWEFIWWQPKIWCFWKASSYISILTLKKHHLLTFFLVVNGFHWSTSNLVLQICRTLITLIEKPIVDFNPSRLILFSRPSKPTLHDLNYENQTTLGFSHPQSDHCIVHDLFSCLALTQKFLWIFYIFVTFNIKIQKKCRK